MPTSLATSLIVIRRLSNFIFFTASVFSSAVNVLDRPGRALTSGRPSLNRLYHNWTCVLLIVDLPNATVYISNILAHLISFLTQNLIMWLWWIFSNNKKIEEHTKTRLNFLSVKNKQTIHNGWCCQHTYINRHVYQHNRKETCENRA